MPEKCFPIKITINEKGELTVDVLNKKDLPELKAVFDDDKKLKTFIKSIQDLPATLRALRASRGS